MPVSEFYNQVDRACPILGVELFDHVPDTVYFIKDRQGRYVVVNKTLSVRLGMEQSELVGKKAEEVFPDPLGARFTRQDMLVMQTGAGIKGRLEMHLYPSGKQGWCLTYKEPVKGMGGKLIGIVGISRDIHPPTEHRDDLAPLQKVITHIRLNVAEPLRLPQLAEMVNLSVYQLDQRIRGLFHLSAGQFITQTRIEKACNLLKCTDQGIANVALDCGYSDQSAFTRQFKQTTGLTPKAYRKQVK
ncbi:MAG: helix-turn-helix domain-containing protein [Akkermansiaceae bacterium]